STDRGRPAPGYGLLEGVQGLAPHARSGADRGRVARDAHRSGQLRIGEETRGVLSAVATVGGEAHVLAIGVAPLRLAAACVPIEVVVEAEIAIASDHPGHAGVDEVVLENVGTAPGEVGVVHL